MDMKIIIAFFIAAAVAAGTCFNAGAQTTGAKSEDVINLVHSYSGKDGFQVISVGKFGINIAKVFAKKSAETKEEKKEIMEFMDGLQQMVVVDFEDAADSQKAEFKSKIADFLKNSEKIVEMKDKGESMNIYGSSSDDGETIDDLIIYAPEDCALICLFGKVSAKNISEMMDSSK